ncbi:histidine transporter [Sporosarcina ureilytica]|uniref:Histidine transporter n=2 Tax=Sporosarcina ureilytica TaxID=298596 RepID=A0A1D8JKA8_9BACL|nr:histidine transporter [Sporosarcina ureilytica]
MAHSYIKFSNIFKLVFYSAVGAFMFFIPITIDGKSSIMLDHIVTFLRGGIPPFVIHFYIAIILVVGATYPFVTRTWNKTITSTIMSFLKVVGLILGLMLILGVGPAWMFQEDMGPFILNALVTPVSILVPVGALFLALLVGYGLLEFIGILMQPVMRPIFRTPGRSAIDAVASFVGSYSIGLLVTNRIYNEGKYTKREAIIVATGFSTVSATFMVVIANTLDIMSIWNFYFWTSLVITFTVTAITTRLWPISSTPDTYVNGEGDPELVIEKDRLKTAWNEALKVADDSEPLYRYILVSLKEGIQMVMSILPTILSVGLLGLVLATYTPIFDLLGYIFYPITYLLKIPEPLLVAKASAISITEIFLPSLLVVGAPLMTKYIVAVLSVSSILFFSASIPSMLATDIPFSVPKLVVIWFIRVVLTLMITTPVAYLFL